MKNLKKLAAMAAIFGTTYGANAFEKEFDPAKDGENQGIESINGQLMVKTQGGKVGEVDMPYVFVGTNTTNFAQNGFAVKQMADANSMLLDKDNNDVYFTRSSTNGVYKMAVLNKTTLNGVSGQLEFFESKEPVKILSVKDGVIYTQNNDAQVVELGNLQEETRPENNITIPEALSNTVNAVYGDYIYVAQKDGILKYDENGEYYGRPGVNGLKEDPKKLFVFDEKKMFVLDKGGFLYDRGGTVLKESVSDVSLSKDGKTLLITSTNDNGKMVVTSYNPENGTASSVYTEPADAKKPFASKQVSVNGIKYFVREKAIGYE